jgi:hypothetical protein
MFLKTLWKSKSILRKYILVPINYRYRDDLKGQSHEKFGEMRVLGLSLGHN